MIFKGEYTSAESLYAAKLTPVGVLSFPKCAYKPELGGGCSYEEERNNTNFKSGLTSVKAYDIIVVVLLL